MLTDYPYLKNIKVLNNLFTFSLLRIMLNALNIYQIDFRGFICFQV